MADLDQYLSRYAAFFGRPPDLVAKGESYVVARFSPKKVGFLGRIFTPLSNNFVYITCGLSLSPMAVPPDESSIYEDRIELMGVSDNLYVDDAGVDNIAKLLLTIPQLCSEGRFFGPGITISFPEPLISGTQMTGVLFSLHDLDMNRLCKCTPAARQVVSIIPITDDERDYAAANGFLALVDIFERSNVPMTIDPARKSAVPPSPD